MTTSLIYVHDPMCSWCFGISDALQNVLAEIPVTLPVLRLLGGLAPDSDEPMLPEMQLMLKQTWQRIEEQIPGIKFNFEFWEKCHARRSTYPACRAVIAARFQGLEFDSLMTRAIQQAYYRDAKNPSNDDTLISLAETIGLEVKRFEIDLYASTTQEILTNEIQTARELGITSYPSLAVVSQNAVQHIDINYTDADKMLDQIIVAADS